MAKWPYSTRRWQRLRTAQLLAQPFCVFCEQYGRDTLATVVDHIVPVRDDRSMAFDQDNLQSLCASCHSGPKQSEERGGDVGGYGIDGIPLKGWE